MKKIFMSVILLLTVLLIGCKGESNADELIEKYQNSSDDLQSISLPKYDWLTEDEGFSPIVYDGNIIYPDGNYTISGDRLIYYAKVNSGTSTLSYISLNSGESFTICPDPLCPHLRDSGCRYVDFVWTLFPEESDNEFYAVKALIDSNGNHMVLYKIDTESGAFTELYRVASEADVIKYLELYSFTDGRVYFQEVVITEKENDRKELVKETDATLLSVDVSSLEVDKVSDDFDGDIYNQIKLMHNGRIFIEDTVNRRLFVTDMNFENRRELFEYDSDHIIASFNYKKDTDELYFVMRSKYISGLSGSRELTDGSIYLIDGDLNVSRLEMPDEGIIDIQFYGDRIYYTKYDPIYLGNGPRGKVIDYDGNKLYCVNINDLSTSEVFFDGHDELYIPRDGFLVLGDYLFIDYTELVEEGSMVYFRSMGITAQINIEKQTIRWLTLQ